MLGRSLGGAVALNLISNLDQEKQKVYKGVIIENTFTSISEMVDPLVPMFKAFPTIKNLMLKIKWDSMQCVQNMKTPVLFITGDLDTFVPWQMT